MMMPRSSSRLVRRESSPPGSRSTSRFSPSGVISNTQLNATAGTSPTASTMISVRRAASDRSKAGKVASATWITSQLTAT